MSSELPMPSFAKVAATVSTRHSSNEPSPQPPTTSTAIPVLDVSTRAIEPAVVGHERPMEPTQALSPRDNMPTVRAQMASTDSDDVVRALGNLQLQPQAPKDISALQLQRPPVISRESGASDDSHKADSSSELGTKPPSLDGKSITSGTTFALDEKESLRPDDSASVQNATEDDDTFSIRGSHFAGSRVGSDLAARARGIQLGDMPDRRLMHTTSASSGQGILTPQSTSSEQQSRTGAEIPPLAMGQDPDALNLTYRHAPDDKLIEAMGTMKDRLYLLRLEKELISFVENSKEPFMDLEQSNSFLRMLAHKLADYYHMTHSFEPNLQKVRIFRTPFCRVPTSLAHFDPAPNPSTSSTPPPVVLPKKIMQRGQDGDGGPVSTNPSKPTSETGSDPRDKDSSSNNQKLTREEREEAYKLAREKIFGSADENAADVDKDTVPSRTSSVSGNRASNGKGRRSARHRRDDSDSFDSRNHYAPCWGPQQQTWMPPQYGQPPNAQGMPPQAPVYNAQMPHASHYGQQNIPQYQGMPSMPPNTGYPMYTTPQYPPQPSQQRYPSGGSPMVSYGSSAPGTPQQQSWQPTAYSPGYQGPSGPPSSAGQNLPPGIPYAFGQLPAHLNPNDPKSQHPIPGSYSRGSAFNPKTQSFVPGGNNMPQASVSQPPFTAPPSHHGSPQVGTSHPSFPGYQQGVPQPYGGGYGMVRQASNTSLPGYHPPPQMPSYPQQAPTHHNLHQPHQPPPPLQHINPNQTQSVPNRPPLPHQGMNHVFTHLPTYGNPATLPQKPATGF